MLNKQQAKEAEAYLTKALDGAIDERVIKHAVEVLKKFLPDDQLINSMIQAAASKGSVGAQSYLANLSNANVEPPRPL